MARYDNILQTIGNTPLVRLNKLAPDGVHVHVKVESFNPLGSVKDRMANAVIEDAEKRGLLQPGQTVVEATSGNTGIGLAMVCAQKGYPLVLTMAESFSIERRKLLRFLGARVVLTPASEKGTGMLNKAIELARAHGWYLPRQFDNEANADVHTRTTAQEILRDLAGERVYAFVSGFGTGGTLLGVARGLKAADPAIRIVAVEPDNSPVLASGIAQVRDAEGWPSASHPQFRPHLMQGWSPDFISRLTESAVAEGLVDEIVPVGGNDALRRSRELATREGIFVGISSGATLVGALEVARRAPPGSHIVCMLPDTGERYLSTPLFDGIEVDMNEAELELSRSTPGYRFDAPTPASPKVPATAAAPAIAVAPTAPAAPATAGMPTPAAAPPTPGILTPAAAPAPVAARTAAAVPGSADPSVDAEADAYVDEAVASQPVVMFALEWCEFSWSVRKLFARLGVAYRSVDIDAAALQQHDLGTRIRAALKAKIGAPRDRRVVRGRECERTLSEKVLALSDAGVLRRLGHAG
jgi:cysteine synthase A